MTFGTEPITIAPPISGVARIPVEALHVNSSLGFPLKSLEVRIKDANPISSWQSHDSHVKDDSLVVHYDIDRFTNPIIAVHVAGLPPRLCASRRIPLAGCTNFRDGGGYPTATGYLPWRQTYRSENLVRLTSQDWQTIHRLGITTIVDLRNEDEANVDKTPLPPQLGIEIVHFPMKGFIEGNADTLSGIVAGSISEISEVHMHEMYLNLLANHQESFSQLSSILDEPKRAPLLVHCTAGKDRTGLAIAFYQLRAGVPLNYVMEDYLLSNLYRTPLRMRELSQVFQEAHVKPSAVRSFLSVQRLTLLKAMEFVTGTNRALISQTPNDL